MRPNRLAKERASSRGGTAGRGLRLGSKADYKRKVLRTDSSAQAKQMQ